MSNEDFIAAIAPLVQKYAPQYGIESNAAVIAQAINESGWGQSLLASKYHNYFGMKCGTKWQGASVNLQTQEEYQPGTLTMISDNFRVYGSMDEGVRGYFEFIQLQRYQNLRGIKDARTYLQTIKDDGYATSSLYVDNCMALVEQFNLTRFDNQPTGGSMAVLLAQASCDERGKYVGGQAGNQSGTELNTRGYYESSGNPWKCYRAKDAGMANRIAQQASGAVANMNIGYDQGERNTIRTAAQRFGMMLASIAEKCECDCASLGAECAICAGSSDAALFAGGNLLYTGNAHAKLMATGDFDSLGTIPQSQLCVGDLLVRDGHMVIVVSGNPRSGGSSGSASNAVTTVDITELANAVINGRFGNGDARRAALGDKYDAVQAEVNRILSGTPNAPGTSTGSARIVAGTYRVIASDGLNVRANPSTSAEIVAGYGYGDEIYSIAADITEADGYTWAHYTGKSGASRYVALGTMDGSEKYLARV